MENRALLRSNGGVAPYGYVLQGGLAQGLGRVASVMPPGKEVGFALRCRRSLGE